VAPTHTPYLIPPVARRPRTLLPRPSILYPHSHPHPHPHPEFHVPQRSLATLLYSPSASPACRQNSIHHPRFQISHRKLLRTKVQIEAASSAAKELLNIVGGRCNPSHFMRAPARPVLSSPPSPLNGTSSYRTHPRSLHSHPSHSFVKTVAKYVVCIQLNNRDALDNCNLHAFPPSSCSSHLDGRTYQNTTGSRAIRAHLSFQRHRLLNPCRHLPHPLTQALRLCPFSPRLTQLNREAMHPQLPLLLP
jgi:hypothetical protein